MTVMNAVMTKEMVSYSKTDVLIHAQKDTEPMEKSANHVLKTAVPVTEVAAKNARKDGTSKKEADNQSAFHVTDAIKLLSEIPVNHVKLITVLLVFQAKKMNVTFAMLVISYSTRNVSTIAHQEL
jgi:hypothetical protein